MNRSMKKGTLSRKKDEEKKDDDDVEKNAEEAREDTDRKARKTKVFCLGCRVESVSVEK